MAWMRSELPRPPRRITPDALYIDYLPRLWAAFIADRALPWPPWTLEAQPGIDDSGATAVYTMHFAAGVLTGRPGAANAPALTGRCDRDAWDIALQSLLPRILAFI